MIVDQDAGVGKTLTDVLTTKGYEVTESIEKDLVEKAITINRILSLLIQR
ncbi:MAG: hypothetical protein IPP73_10060 [Chitinophagaceae bacterium]|nr:hypothetical protein [Chitinophagaceae bacterium]